LLGGRSDVSGLLRDDGADDDRLAANGFLWEKAPKPFKRGGRNGNMGERGVCTVDEDEVTVWLERLATGDEVAARQIWSRYIQQMLSFARQRLAAANRRVTDEEDLAVSAFHSLCQRVERGQFPDLKDRESLWKLLTTIIARKAMAEMRRNFSHKRGAGKVSGESVFFHVDASRTAIGLDNIAGAEPTPEFAAEMIEQCSRLLNCLSDDCRRIALYKLDGFSNDQIAEMLNMAPRTIERKLASIRGTWQEAGLSSEGE
jgi:RNA polymerase sigma factor (sigma-70 family)